MDNMDIFESNDDLDFFMIMEYTHSYKINVDSSDKA